MQLKGLKVLVTGGAGFVGSHIVDDLKRSGASVRVFDNFSSGHRENLAASLSGIEIMEGDILDAPSLMKASKGMDLICHQAAQLEIMRCLETPSQDLRSNTEGTLNVLEAARRNGISKVVYASSACVYGQAAYTPQDEAHPTVPNWPYGVSKLATEHYARLYHEYYGIKTIGLRYSIVYGPHEWFGRVLTAYLKRALEKKPPVVWGGLAERDFIFVGDVVNAHRLCVENDALGCEVFNVSTGIATTIRQLAELVCRQFDLGHPVDEAVEPGQASKLVAGRIRLPGELKQMVLSPQKAKKMLGWSAQVSLADGLRSEYQWLECGGAARWQTMHY